jgi:hypothetical protein
MQGIYFSINFVPLFFLIQNLFKKQQKKGFFKRSMVRSDKYLCFFGKNCQITAKNRNRCKSCRFQKCLKIGMSIEGVKMGRIPKIQKEMALELLNRGKYKNPLLLFFWWLSVIKIYE